jgi:two-component system sensor histidine kinase/response regulator
MKILLAEDEKMAQNSIINFCKKFEIGLDVVGNGEEAFNKCKTETYDLILMDLIMPVMDGVQATKEIKSLVNGDSFKIIALTGGTFCFI